LPWQYCHPVTCCSARESVQEEAMTAIKSADQGLCRKGYNFSIGN